MAAAAKEATGEEGDEEFESASETDWDMRDEGPTTVAELEHLRLTSTGQKGAGADEAAPAGRLRDSDPGEGGFDAEDMSKEVGKSSNGMFSKMSGLLGFIGTAAPPPEVVSGTVVARLEGSWLSHVDFDGTR